LSTVLVTGAARGIGLETARLFLRAGWRVLALDKDFSGFPLQDIPRVEFDLKAVGEIPALIKRLGEIHVLINNAATLYCHPHDAFPEADALEILAVNLRAPVALIEALAPQMRARRAGRIVNVASVAAKRISFTAAASYTASKAGLLGFTRHLAYEVAPYGINVNAICPGPTLTPMYERNADEQTRRERIAMVPKGRWITPADHGRVVVFLCSASADALCGLAVDVDGGSLLGWMPWAHYMTKRKRK